MADVGELLKIIEDAKALVSRPENDYSWSSWEDEQAALKEIEDIRRRLEDGVSVHDTSLNILFMPTGPMQEVSLNSGWGDEFTALADRFDSAMAQCSCFERPVFNFETAKDLGMDSRYAEVSVMKCPICGQNWLRYFHENEAFTRSGQWYFGPISPAQADGLSAKEAKSMLENLDWYFVGGSYFDGNVAKGRGPLIGLGMD